VGYIFDEDAHKIALCETSNRIDHHTCGGDLDLTKKYPEKKP
jgi:hypothetical protein